MQFESIFNEDSEDGSEESEEGAEVLLRKLQKGSK
jgi:hypothetical protein